MEIREIIAELEGAAIWEAAGISALETTRFEPELDARAQEAIAASRKRVAALGEAVKLLRRQQQIAYAPGNPNRPNQAVAGWSWLGFLRPPKAGRAAT